MKKKLLLSGLVPLAVLPIAMSTKNTNELHNQYKMVTNQNIRVNDKMLGNSDKVIFDEEVSYTTAPHPFSKIQDDGGKINTSSDEYILGVGTNSIIARSTSDYTIGVKIPLGETIQAGTSYSYIDDQKTLNIVYLNSENIVRNYKVNSIYDMSANVFSDIRKINVAKVGDIRYRYDLASSSLNIFYYDESDLNGNSRIYYFNSRKIVADKTIIIAKGLIGFELRKNSNFYIIYPKYYGNSSFPTNRELYLSIKANELLIQEGAATQLVGFSKLPSHVDEKGYIYHFLDGKGVFREDSVTHSHKVTEFLKVSDNVTYWNLIDSGRFIYTTVPGEGVYQYDTSSMTKTLISTDDKVFLIKNTTINKIDSIVMSSKSGKTYVLNTFDNSKYNDNNFVTMSLLEGVDKIKFISYMNDNKDYILYGAIEEGVDDTQPVNYLKIFSLNNSGAKNVLYDFSKNILNLRSDINDVIKTSDGYLLVMDNNDLVFTNFKDSMKNLNGGEIIVSWSFNHDLNSLSYVTKNKLTVINLNNNSRFELINHDFTTSKVISLINYKNNLTTFVQDGDSVYSYAITNKKFSKKLVFSDQDISRNSTPKMIKYSNDEIIVFKKFKNLYTYSLEDGNISLKATNGLNVQDFYTYTLNNQTFELFLTDHELYIKNIDTGKIKQISNNVDISTKIKTYDGKFIFKEKSGKFVEIKIKIFESLFSNDNDSFSNIEILNDSEILYKDTLGNIISKNINTGIKKIIATDARSSFPFKLFFNLKTNKNTLIYNGEDGNIYKVSVGDPSSKQLIVSNDIFTTCLIKDNLLFFTTPRHTLYKYNFNQMNKTKIATSVDSKSPLYIFDDAGKEKILFKKVSRDTISFSTYDIELSSVYSLEEKTPKGYLSSNYNIYKNNGEYYLLYQTFDTRRKRGSTSLVSMNLNSQTNEKEVVINGLNTNNNKLTTLILDNIPFLVIPTNNSIILHNIITGKEKIILKHEFEGNKVSVMTINSLDKDNSELKIIYKTSDFKGIWSKTMNIEKMISWTIK